MAHQLGIFPKLSCLDIRGLDSIIGCAGLEPQRQRGHVAEMQDAELSNAFSDNLFFFF